MGVVLSINDLRKHYVNEGEPVRAVDGVSLDVHQGAFVLIMGSSGSGKSTLLHLIGGLDRSTGGTITIEGRDITKMSDRQLTLFRRDRLGIVFQAYNLLPTLTALENVMLPAIIGGSEGRAAETKARSLLDLVDLNHRLTHRPQTMSGGEQQRVAVARAMMNDPALILADEPTGNLDSQHGDAVWRLLSKLVREEGRTVIAVTHEPSSADFADRVVFLRDGRVVDQTERRKVDDSPMDPNRHAQLAR